MAWTLTNADIISALPLLADHYEKADSGSDTQLVCTRLTNLVNSEVVGATIAFVNGDNAGSDAVVTSYSSGSGTLGFAQLSNAVNNQTGFGIVYISYQVFIDRAYDIIANEMRNKGIDVDLFLTTSHVKELHLTKTIELVCLSKRHNADADDIYHESYLVFKEKYEKEVTTLKADYDLDEDGTIDEDIEEKVSAQVRLIR